MSRRDLTDAMMRPHVVRAVQSLHPGLRFYDEVNVIVNMEKSYGSGSFLDLFGVGDTLVGVEIKSDKDTFTRLPRQASHYRANCDVTYVAVGERLLKKMHEIPSDFGILLCYDGGDAIQVELVREPTHSTPPLHALLSLLWRDELVHLLRLHDLYKGMSKARVYQIKQALAPIGEELRPQIKKLLFERDWKDFYPEPDEHVAVTLYEGDGGF